MSDIAARSGSSSPARASSSSFVNLRYSCCSLMNTSSGLRGRIGFWTFTCVLLGDGATRGVTSVHVRRDHGVDVARNVNASAASPDTPLDDLSKLHETPAFPRLQ